VIILQNRNNRRKIKLHLAGMGFEGSLYKLPNEKDNAYLDYGLAGGRQSTFRADISIRDQGWG
jgi:hypothetical protein